MNVIQVLTPHLKASAVQPSEICFSSATLAVHVTFLGCCCHIGSCRQHAAVITGWIRGPRAGNHSRTETAGPPKRVRVPGHYWTIGTICNGERTYACSAESKLLHAHERSAHQLPALARTGRYPHFD